METNFELYVGLVHRADVGDVPTVRLGAALNATRKADRVGRTPRRSARPAAAYRGRPCARRQSPSDRVRGIAPNASTAARKHP
jgi:hypothetical protein